MATFTRIVVPLDGSPTAEQVLPFARALGAALRVPIKLLAVIDTTPLLTSTDKARRFDELVESITQQSSVYLEATARGMGEVIVDWRVERGNPAETILDIAALEAAPLIAMATHGRSGIKRWLLGSVAEKLVRGSTHPLLLVKADAAASAGELPVRSIIVPLDGSTVAESVLPTAVELAHVLRADLVLARASEIPAKAYYRDEGEEAAKAFIPNYEDAREYLAQKVEETQRQETSAVRHVVMNGPAAEQIIDLAQQTEGSLIAMCAHGKSGMKRWLLGSVTEKVVRHGGVPVLVSRPT